MFQLCQYYWIFRPNIIFFAQISDWLYQKTDCLSMWQRQQKFCGQIFSFLTEYLNFWLIIGFFSQLHDFFLLNIGLIESKDWLQQYQKQYDRCFNSVNLTWQWGSLIPGGENKRKWTNRWLYLSTTIFSASYPAITHTRLQGCKLLAVEIFFLFFKKWFVCELIWS